MSETNPFENWAVVAHNDDTGFGRQAEDLKSNVGVKWHFVIPSERLFDKPLNTPFEIMLPPDAPDHYVRDLMRKIEGIIFFERPGWHPNLLKICKEEGVKTICCPNWEWFAGNDPLWKLCDLFVYTSQFCKKIIEQYGFTNHVNIGPWPLDRKNLPIRKVEGKARFFVHNAGIVDPQDRKGTRDTIKAFKKTSHPDIRLLVRMQKAVELPKLDDPRIRVEVGNLSSPAQLYESGDVFIQPSKMEGNGFMVLEPLFCGLPVITLDYPPMNEYVPTPNLLVRKKPFRRKAFPTPWIKHAHLRLPSISDLRKKIEWCAYHDMRPISERNLQWSDAQGTKDSILTRWKNVTQYFADKHD